MVVAKPEYQAEAAVIGALRANTALVTALGGVQTAIRRAYDASLSTGLTACVVCACRTCVRNQSITSPVVYDAVVRIEIRTTFDSDASGATIANLGGLVRAVLVAAGFYAALDSAGTINTYAAGERFDAREGSRPDDADGEVHRQAIDLTMTFTAVAT
jgi:hypothetical protein